MFTKKNYILFIILLVLVAGAWAYTVPLQHWREEERNRDSKNFLSHVDISAIDSIAVTRPDEDKTYTITRSNGIWLFQPGNWPTEQILMDALEEKLTNIAASTFTIVSVNADNQANFGITPEAPQVTLQQGDTEIARFIIGNVSSDYRATYIGRENDPNTYSIPETLVRAFDVTSWQDRTITNISTESIDTVTLAYPTQTITLTNTPATSGEIYWRSTQPYEVRLNKEKVEEFLSKAGKLEAADIPEQTDIVPELTLIIAGSGVNERLIIGGVAQDGNYLVKHENTGRVYAITKESRDALLKQIRDFQ